jgi:hypothetical protein
MKPKESGARGAVNRRPKRMEPLPMEWMDSMSWRLPSGKALAEFALQSGFLAPLMLTGPYPKASKQPAPAETAGPVVDKRTEEAPDSTGSFRGAE